MTAQQRLLLEKLYEELELLFYEEDHNSNRPTTEDIRDLFEILTRVSLL